MNNIESIKSFFSSELVLIIGVFFVLFVAMRKKRGQHFLSGAIAITTLILSFFALVFTHFDKSMTLFHGMIALDPFGQFFKVIIIATALIVIIMATRSRELETAPKPEFYAFLLVLTLGLNFLSVANNMIMLYLSLEMASLVSYVLAGYLAEDTRSDEAGLKYVLYGGVASGVMIFGMSFLYGLTGTLDFVGVREFCLSGSADPLFLFLSLLMIFGGLGYKMAVVPFHMWSPDVYEGSPMTVTAFLSVASKAAGFAITLRFFLVAFVGMTRADQWMALGKVDWPVLIAALSALTMTVGNVLALQQMNIKRFLAYSSIAHAGYLLMGLAVVSRIGVESVLFYFMVYFLMNLGAFLVAIIISNQHKTENMEDYKGLIKQNRFAAVLALCLAVFLFSLAGLPPFAGFVAKWYVFKAAVDAGLIWLVVIAVINSVIGLFYYVRLIKFMMIDDKGKDLVLRNTNWRYSSFILIFAALTIFFGLYFEPLAKWAKASAVFFY